MVGAQTVPPLALPVVILSAETVGVCTDQVYRRVVGCRVSPAAFRYSPLSCTAHCRDVSLLTAGHIADTDEATFEPESGQRLRHPRVSSVLYLSECGGPTLVTDKTPGSAGLGARGALVWPDPGRCGLWCPLLLSDH